MVAVLVESGNVVDGSKIIACSAPFTLLLVPSFLNLSITQYSCLAHSLQCLAPHVFAHSLCFLTHPLRTPSLTPIRSFT